ncbi:hypothetical protein LE181_03260 [Streptomyces sp. SCA3-4]|uniref:DUF6083 domain-containing protein n=1 Tax=Streptomyces sichuanensis TaxID=2871810 RepID=UPI001CE37593|nr:DUF6083 domain-containing protein [Streptomyces sichuanensis]MCA6091187.1 hypothetical protein [Streptomyces sichuanensis]
MGVTYEPSESDTTAPSPHCPDCTSLQDLHQTQHHRYVLLEHQRQLPARWTVLSDGTAINSAGPEAAYCRIPHAIVCPCGKPPGNDTPALKALWEYNSGLTAHFNPPTAEAG